MKRRRHTPKQIIRKLREAERLLGEGMTIPEPAKAVGMLRDPLGVSERWACRFGEHRSTERYEPKRAGDDAAWGYPRAHRLGELGWEVGFTREGLEMLVARSIDADRTVAVLERLAAQRGAPQHLRMDNGPELTGYALRDWCVSYQRWDRVHPRPARHGRTPTSRAFTPATSCSTSKNSLAWPRRRC